MGHTTYEIAAYGRLTVTQIVCKPPYTTFVSYKADEIS